MTPYKSWTAASRSTETEVAEVSQPRRPLPVALVMVQWSKGICLHFIYKLFTFMLSITFICLQFWSTVCLQFVSIICLHFISCLFTFPLQVSAIYINYSRVYCRRNGYRRGTKTASPEVAIARKSAGKFKINPRRSQQNLVTYFERENGSRRTASRSPSS